MNSQLFKKDQVIIDLSRAYDLTIRYLISSTFSFVTSNSKITEPKVLKQYKRDIIYAIWNGCDYAITNRSVIGSNDILTLIKFMQGLVKPSEKLTTNNFLSEDIDELIKALNEGVNRMLIEEVKLLDKYSFTKKQKNSMIATLINYEVTKEEVGVIEPID